MRRVRITAGPEPLPSVAEVVARLRPDGPVHCLRPAVLEATARGFVAAFPGDVLYAVKCNPEPLALRALWRGGVRHFDVASPVEIRLLRRLLPEAALHYMHPVKARSAIAEAYRRHGVRDFALDGFDELAKLRAETGDARDLGLMVRLALPRGSAAVCDMSGKFGAPAVEATALLRAARPLARRLGVTFHVGSQCLEPAAFERALDLTGAVLAGAGVEIDMLDVGGGFPVPYPGMAAPPVGDFLAAIGRGVARLGLPDACRLWCEPGRLLVAAAGSVVVRVLRRRGPELFVTDGMYGSLIDAARLGFRFPARLVRLDGDSRAPEADFVLFGPSCDSGDRMPGPFALPDDVAEGDWIELGQLGSYGSCQRTDFNGFGAARLALVRDGPVDG